jgi:hypothetical protein
MTYLVTERYCAIDSFLRDAVIRSEGRVLQDHLSIAMTFSESFAAQIRIVSNLNILEELRQLAKHKCCGPSTRAEAGSG